VGSVGVRGIRRPLDATVSQAEALMERRFITVEEPKVPELARLSQAMNTVVGRLKTLFDEQAGQVETLRQQAHCDSLTGVAHRGHFMAQLQTMLSSDDGPTGGVVWLIRVVDLGGINRSLGHRQTDQLLRRLAVFIADVTQGVPAAVVGRLNGGDFAVALGDGGVPLPQADNMADALKRLFAEEGVHGRAVVGSARWQRGAAMAQVLALADAALARAEIKQGFAVESVHAGALGSAVALGEDQWRKRLLDTIAGHRGQLVQFPVIDRGGRLVHQECPMRLQLEVDGPHEAAAQWLPMALRCGLMHRLDILAVEMALRDIAADGVARGVNLSPASLMDSGFLPQLRSTLLASPEAARALWVEVAEAAAVDNFAMVRELCKQLKGLGVRVGLEHAGDRLTRVEFLFEAGLDYVKLDASVVQGVAADGARAAFVSGMVTMLHSLGLQVYGEGVSDADDLAALWTCGLDGATGPAIKL
jgi:EAL domain-containing protein (putative c-di-GMP-specific phosphodiesterase class I)/GGDEF domain-containing protein